LEEENYQGILAMLEEREVEFDPDLLRKALVGVEDYLYPNDYFAEKRAQSRALIEKAEQAMIENLKKTGRDKRTRRAAIFLPEIRVEEEENSRCGDLIDLIVSSEPPELVPPIKQPTSSNGYTIHSPIRYH